MVIIKVMSTMGIIHSDFQKMTIDIGEAVDFPERRWLMSPQLLGSLTASFLCGSTDRIFELSNKEMDDIIYSSKKTEGVVYKLIHEDILRYKYW